MDVRVNFTIVIEATHNPVRLVILLNPSGIVDNWLFTNDLRNNQSQEGVIKEPLTDSSACLDY